MIAMILFTRLESVQHENLFIMNYGSGSLLFIIIIFTGEERLMPVRVLIHVQLERSFLNYHMFTLSLTTLDENWSFFS